MSEESAVKHAFEIWVNNLPVGWWDSAGDGWGIVGSLEEAFTAGWLASLAKAKDDIIQDIRVSLQHLNGDARSAVSLLTGFDDATLNELGGITE